MERRDGGRLTTDKGCEDAALICKKIKKKAADVVNDFKAVRMNLASLITSSYFLCAYSSRSVVASRGPFGPEYDNNFLRCLTGNIQ